MAANEVKPGETMEEYLARLRPLAVRLAYDDQAIRDHFIAGLTEKIEEVVKAGETLLAC